MEKPTHAKPSLYAYYFTVLKDTAMLFGYNLVIHGSLNRDLDLIAIPWQKEIGDKELMINEFAKILGGDIMPDEDRSKPHGREVWIININRGHWWEDNKDIEGKWIDPQYYIDISITPTVK